MQLSFPELSRIWNPFEAFYTYLWIRKVSVVPKLLCFHLKNFSSDFQRDWIKVCCYRIPTKQPMTLRARTTCTTFVTCHSLSRRHGSRKKRAFPETLDQTTTNKTNRGTKHKRFKTRPNYNKVVPQTPHLGPKDNIDL